MKEDTKCVEGFVPKHRQALQHLEPELAGAVEAKDLTARGPLRVAPP